DGSGPPTRRRSSESVPSSCSRAAMRRMTRFRMRTATYASSSTMTMRSGFETASAASAASLLPVMRYVVVQSQLRWFGLPHASVRPDPEAAAATSLGTPLPIQIAPGAGISGSARLRAGEDVGDALADDAGGTARRHGDPVEDVAGLHRALLVRHDQQLRLVAELVDEVEEAMQVHVVERGLHLVE